LHAARDSLQDTRPQDPISLEKRGKKIAVSHFIIALIYQQKKSINREIAAFVTAVTKGIVLSVFYRISRICQPSKKMMIPWLTRQYLSGVFP